MSFPIAPAKLPSLEVSPDKLAAFDDAFEEVSELLMSIADHLFYHNIAHTLSWVLGWCDRLGRLAKLSSDDIFLLRLAALFHDVGYKNMYSDNEPIGAQFASNFMARYPCFSESDITTVSSLIIATNLSFDVQNTESDHLRLLQCIIRDADVAHLASESYAEQAENLRRELEHQFQKEIPQCKWNQDNLKFFDSHQWLSPPAKELFEEGKKSNYNLLLNLTRKC
ncbi:hypothetical protein P9112_012777 [Eukaryota sp. TZLM1-RC]